jgi:threonine/homoserine/homoserine lactone efflux protein
LLSKQDSYTENQTSKGTSGFRSNYLSGFIVGGSNPKAILFFTALFPQFITPDVALLTQYFVFAGTFIVLELSWLVFYAYLGASSSRWLLAEGRAKLFNRLTGGVFVSAGALLSMTSRS